MFLRQLGLEQTPCNGACIASRHKLPANAASWAGSSVTCDVMVGQRRAPGPGTCTRPCAVRCEPASAYLPALPTTVCVTAQQVLYVHDSLAIISGLNADAPPGTKLSFVTGATGCDTLMKMHDAMNAIHSMKHEAHIFSKPVAVPNGLVSARATMSMNITACMMQHDIWSDSSLGSCTLHSQCDAKEVMTDCPVCAFSL